MDWHGNRRVGMSVHQLAASVPAGVDPPPVRDPEDVHLGKRLLDVPG